jgi:2-oxoglutarate ferredoxin oxidoreductase subunit alpha
LAAAAAQVKGLLVVEMNAGQMLEDVRLAVGPEPSIRFLGRMGGMVPLPEEIVYEAQHLGRVLQSHNGARKGAANGAGNGQATGTNGSSARQNGAAQLRSVQTL